MEKSNTTIKGNEFICEDCKSTEKIDLPMPINEVSKRAKAFSETHKECAEKFKLGSLTVGFNTPEQREIPIESFFRVYFADNRLCNCVKIKDGSYVVSVENPESSGRNTKQQIWVSPESLLGMITAVLFHFESDGKDLMELMKKATKDNGFNYDFSDNLKPKP